MGTIRNSDVLRKMPFLHLSAFNTLILLLTFFLFGFWALDPLIAMGARSLDPSVRPVLKAVTNFGRTEWILLPCLFGIAVCVLLNRQSVRRSYRAAYRCLIQLMAYIAVAVCVPGIISSLLKNMIGRARPKFMDALGTLDFTPFAFTADYASFPSGHVTTIFAFAAAVTYLWPKIGISVFAMAFWVGVTRIFLEAHYFTDVVGGALLGGWGAWLIAVHFAQKGWAFRLDPVQGIKVKGKHVLSRYFRTILRSPSRSSSGRLVGPSAVMNHEMN